jgi:hypothetical protein
VSPAFTRFTQFMIYTGVAVFVSYSILLGFGNAIKLGPITYYADEWYWLSLNLDSLSSNACKLLGHPFVVPNINLYLNYEYMNASATLRSISTVFFNVAGFALIGVLVVKRTKLSIFQKCVVLLAFAAFGLSGTLTTKVFWAIGVSDAVVMACAAVSVLGVAYLSEGKRTRGWLMLVIFGVIGTASFGSGIAIWPSMTIVLLLLRQVRDALIYFLIGICVISLIMLALPHCQGNAGASLLGSIGGFSLNPMLLFQTAAIALGYFPAHVMGKQGNWALPELIPVWTLVGGVLFVGLAALTVRLFIKRQVADAYWVGLLGLSILLVGAGFMIGIARSSTFGAQVGFEGRYASMATMFWVCTAGIGLRYFIVKGYLASTLVLLMAMATTLVVTNQHQVGHFSAHHQHLAVSASAVALAGADKHDSQNVRNYLAIPSWIVDSTDKLMLNKKDIFSDPVRIGSFIAIPGQQCLGSAFLLPQYDEAGILGVGGWIASPQREIIDRVYIVSNGEVRGIGFHADLWISMDKVFNSSLLTGWNKLIYDYFPMLAMAYDISPGWVGVMRKPDQVSEIRIFGQTSSGERCMMEIGSL